MMYLKNVRLSRYSAENPLKGSIEFEGETGEIKLVLTEGEVADLVRSLAGILVRHAESAARRMTAECLMVGRVEIGAETSPRAEGRDHG